MKIQLRFSLILLGAALLYLTGCKKHEPQPRDVTITGNYTTSTPLTKDGKMHWTGNFTTSGAFTTSGTTAMDIQITPSQDSANCKASFTTHGGSFSLNMHCAFANNTGHWNITSGTGRYGALQGEGTLIMSFHPNVPTGLVGIEALTGEVWMH